MKIEVSNINLETTLLSGQAFRVYKEIDSSFTVVLDDRVVNIKMFDNYLMIDSNNMNNLKEKIIEYLDLNRDYEKINNTILAKNTELKDIIEYSFGYKILKQNSFEMIISYIISQNNRVTNISSSIEKLSQLFGKKVIFRDKEYFLFPTFDELKNVTLEELNLCKVGFRNIYIMDAINKIKSENNYINKISKLNTEDALNELMKIKGIGLKVASCILLFGFSSFNTYPIDTWVKKYYNEENIDKIKLDAEIKYGQYKGLVLQYIFNYNRNRNTL